MGEDTIQYELEVTGQKSVTYTCFYKLFKEMKQKRYKITMISSQNTKQADKMMKLKREYKIAN